MPDVSETTAAPASTAAPSVPQTDTGSSPASSASTSATSTPAQAPKTLAQKLQANATGSEGTPVRPQGPIPFDRHESILKSTREASEKALREIEEQIGWARGLSKEAVERYRQYDEALSKDDVQVGMEILRRALQDPNKAARLRSMIPTGQPVTQTRTSTTDTNDPEPGPDTPQGYSAEGLRAWREWVQRDTLRKAQETFAKEVEPLKRAEQARVQQAQKAEQQRADGQYAESIDATIAKLPHAKDNMEKIVAAFVAKPAKTREDIVANAYAAYHEVIDPIIEGKAKAAAVQTLTNTAQTANSARPTATTKSAPVKATKPNLADRLRANAEAAGIRV